ncbi:MAG: type VI secretion system contractile sheath large subunit [Gammaproteobacteria bacterium]|nr:type VI secretion system contractile sheath large subunit [Gammaproteobacteria bacterium]
MSLLTTSVLESSISFTESLAKPQSKVFDAFLSAINIEDQLKHFFELSKIKNLKTKDDLTCLLNMQIAHIDEMLNEQVNAIMHHPKFQKLEASWRGLLYLTEEAGDQDNIKVKFLDVSWATLVKDLDRAIDFDQSHLFRKIYSTEFGTAGGEPYGVLLGDYQIRHRPGPDHKTDDITALRDISQVAAAAFCPFVTGVDPVLFGVDDFSGLGLPINYENLFSQAEYLKWNAFRSTDDSRFVGLTLPRVLMREPYDYDSYRSDQFRFTEDVSQPDSSGYLWGNGCYAFGSILIKSFSNNSWFTDIRGCHDGIDRGGVVRHLPVPSFKTDSGDVALKYSTDVLISDYSEKILSEYGFIPLCHSKDTKYAVFYGNQSIQGAQSYASNIAEINAKISAMLQYMFCVSRFAHYIKVIGREKVGSFFGAEECETYLHNWLLKYSTGSSSGTEEHLAKYPLAEASVEVREIPGKPGVYSCVTRLKPHMQLDQMVSGVKLVTELSAAKV